MPPIYDILPAIPYLLYGLAIGSFLNVCIYRIPLGQSVAAGRSACPRCGGAIPWRDLVPVFSYLALRGRCRHCRAPISRQYPLVEAANALLYLAVYVRFGLGWESILYCLLSSALLAMSVIDARTLEIPPAFPWFIGLLGALALYWRWPHWQPYAIGALSVSGLIWGIYWLSKGRAIGGGDAKLMMACGLLLGWQLNVLAFVLACCLASVIHPLRMRFGRGERVLALGPYLAAGVWISMMFGRGLWNWYWERLNFF